MHQDTARTLLGIPLPNESKATILEKIKKNIGATTEMYHVVSLNPEIIEATKTDELFKEIVLKAQSTIIDGVGVVWAARVLKIPVRDRITGTDLMTELLEVAGKKRLRVMLIGGSAKMALNIAECYKRQYPEADFFGLEGITTISNPKKTELQELFSIVAARRPHMVFVSFGSPYQEKWLWEHREQFQGCICLGVGGAFDFLGGNVSRAPVFLRRLGLEWLYRLISQPWRWRRQLSLLTFVGDVLHQRFSDSL